MVRISSLHLISRDLSPTTKNHDDTAAIRRYMIEYGILGRDDESVYWVSDDA
jgi:hypothetical protein